MNWLWAALLGVFLVSTGAASAQQPPTVPVRDNRSAEQREAHRDSAFSPISVLGEGLLEPSALDQFVKALSESAPQTDRLDIVVDEFALMDFFPRRLQASLEAAGGGSLVGQLFLGLVSPRFDPRIFEQLGVPPDGEAVICIFSGSVNGQPVQVAAFAEYRTSVMTMLVRRSRAFRTAATEAITRAAQDARATMQAPAAETAPAADAPASTPDATTSQP